MQVSLLIYQLFSAALGAASNHSAMRMYTIRALTDTTVEKETKTTTARTKRGLLRWIGPVPLDRHVQLSAVSKLRDLQAAK